MKPYFLFLILIGCFPLGCDGGDSNAPLTVVVSDINATDHNEKTITVQGIVKLGSEVNFDWIQADCPGQHFLVDDNVVDIFNWVPLGTRIAEDEILPLIDEQYLGKKVEVTGIYTVSWCLHPCCDEALEVKSITILE